MRLVLAALVLACSARREEPAESCAGHLDIALQLLARARAASESGADPWPLSLRGLSELDKARILDKSDAQVVEEMARAYVFLADHRMRHGEDPRPDLEQARYRLTQEAHMAQPGAAQLALASLERAVEVEWILTRSGEENPAGPLAQGIDLARRALEADPRVADAHVALARMHLAISRAGKSVDELAAAQLELDAAADIAPDLLEVPRLRAQVAALAW
jgi:hypothetical protein